jgi:hypothetical protein
MADDSDDDRPGPVDVTFRDLTPENEPDLRRLNAVIFPIRYSVRPGARPRHPRAARFVPPEMSSISRLLTLLRPHASSG